MKKGVLVLSPYWFEQWQNACSIAFNVDADTSDFHDDDEHPRCGRLEVVNRVGVQRSAS
jgi:hypothetical protein